MKSLPLSLLIPVFLACGKTDPDPPDPPDPSGVYSGETREHHEWASPSEGYHESDTLYLDTFRIQLLGADSIAFVHRSYLWKFPKDTSNVYMEWYGTHSNRTFEWIQPDSLLVRYWYYGGNGYSYSSGTEHFSGEKL